MAKRDVLIKKKPYPVNTLAASLLKQDQVKLVSVGVDQALDREVSLLPEERRDVLLELVERTHFQVGADVGGVSNGSTAPPAENRVAWVMTWKWKMQVNTGSCFIY